MTLREHRRNVLRETLEAVAQRAQIDISVLSRLERNAKLNPYYANQIAKGYCVTAKRLEKLLGGNGHGNRAVSSTARVSGKHSSPSTG